MNSFASSSPDSTPPAAAIIVAGGSGQRMGGAFGARKQYLEIDGEPVLLRALRPFLAHPAITSVVVVLPPADLTDLPEWLENLPIELVAGGVERGDSVWYGIAALADWTGIVLIHDGARPFVTREIVDRVLARAGEGGAVAAVRATDTVKEVDETGRILATADRSRLWQAQTPQGFPLEVVRGAYERARRDGWAGTDDASVCERYGVPVVVVEGSPDNIKITNPSDLAIAKAIAARLRAADGGPISGMDTAAFPSE